MSSAAPPPSETRPVPTPPVWVEPITKLFVWAVAITFFLYFFDAVRTLLLGVLAAAAITSLLRPIATWLPGPRSLRGIAVAIVFFLVAAGSIAAAGLYMAEPVRREVAKLPELRGRVNDALGAISGWLGFDEPVTVDTVRDSLFDFFSGTRGHEIFQQTATLLLSIGIAVAFVFFGSLYMLIERRRSLTANAVLLLPSHRRDQMRDAIAALEPRLRWWALGTLVSMLTVGIASYIGFSIVGIEFALPLALLVGLLEVIPTVGPLVGFLIALLMASTQGTTELVGVIVVYLAVQTLESYILIPMIMKQAVKMPPVVTLFTVVFWGMVFGAPGLLLAIPINLVIWTTVEQFVIRPEQERGARAILQPDTT